MPIFSLVGTLRLSPTRISYYLCLRKKFFLLQFENIETFTNWCKNFKIQRIYIQFRFCSWCTIFWWWCTSWIVNILEFFEFILDLLYIFADVENLIYLLKTHEDIVFNKIESNAQNVYPLTIYHLSKCFLFGFKIHTS